MNRNLLSLALVAVGWGVGTSSAQTLACPETYPHSRVEAAETLRLALLTPAAAAIGMSEPKTVQFSGFDPQYAISSIEVRSELIAGQSDIDDDVHEQVEVHLVFTVKHSGGMVETWKLRDDLADHVTIARVNREQGSADELPLPELAATKHEPILRFALREESEGVNSSFRTLYTFVADFSATPPRLRALVCEDNAIGGSSALDAAHAPATTTRCAWQGSRGDFVCTALTRTNSGVSRSSQSRMTLLGGTLLPPLIAGYEVFTTLEEAARRLTTQRASPVVVAGIGEIKPLRAGKPVYVGEGTGQGPELRFFLFDAHGKSLQEVDSDAVADGAPDPTEADAPHLVTCSDSHWDIAADGATPLPASSSIRSRNLFANDEVSIDEVFYERDGLRSVYWLALPQRGEARALLVSSTGASHVHGSVTLRPASVSRYVVASGAKRFRATATIQPRTWLDSSDETQSAASECASKWAIEWKDGGFLSRRLARCESPRGLATISADGSLGAIEAAKHRWE